MLAMTDHMKNMIETKIAHPLAGANNESVLEQTSLKTFSLKVPSPLRHMDSSRRKTGL